MKRFLILFIVLLTATSFAVSPSAQDAKSTFQNGYAWSGNNKDNATLWAQAVEAQASVSGGQIGTGKVYYVDSGVASEGDGTSWTAARDTLDEAIGLCTANRGDYILVAQGHAETVAAANGFDADVAGITIIGAGEGSLRPTFTFSATASDVAIGAANVTIANVRFAAGVSAVVRGISIEAGGDYFSLIGCEFPEPSTSTFEFVRAILTAAGANDVSIIGNTYYNADATGSTNFIDLDAGVVNRWNIVGNLIHGEASEGLIHSDDADLEMYIADNVITNMTTGQHAIEFTAAATGVCENNILVADTIGSALDPGSMRCSGNTHSLGINSGAIDVPLIPGKTYSVSMTSTVSTADDLFDVDGGAILITSFTGVVTTQIQAQATSIEINLDADSGWTDYDFTTAVETNADPAGTRYVFSNANEAVLTPLEGADAGATALSMPWHCGEGMIELGSTAASTGNIKWYMTFIPLDNDVSVVPQ